MLLPPVTRQRLGQPRTPTKGQRSTKDTPPSTGENVQVYKVGLLWILCLTTGMQRLPPQAVAKFAQRVERLRARSSKQLWLEAADTRRRATRARGTSTENKTRPPTIKVAWGFSQNDYGSTCNSRDAHKTINMNPTSTVIRYQSNRPLSTSN
jgi:hypothetical protein